MFHDLRYALRQLRHTPAFTAVAVLTLALGIGANTAIFSVMNAVMLRFLPVREPQRLVYLNTTRNPSGSNQTGHGGLSLNQPAVEALRNERAVFSDVVAFVPLGIGKVPVRYGREPEEAGAEEVTGNFFTGLGVRMALGRGFAPEDESRHSALAVLSYAYWSRRFGRDPGVLGQPFHIKGVPFTIIGVAGPGFGGLDQGAAADVWVPFQDRPELKPWGSRSPDSGLYNAPNWWFMMAAGRLAPGVTEQQALARVTPVFQRAAYSALGAPSPKEERPRLFFQSARGVQGLRQNYEEPIRILMVMVLLVLAIACANVSMLLVARNAARRREFSLRLALGGSRARLFRQLLAESLLLVTAGCALGWLFALWATRALSAWSALEVSLAPDRTVLLFTLAASLVAGLVFGLAPLGGAARAPIGLALKTSAATAHRERSGVRGSRVVLALQMSLCVVLLVAAGLLVRTLRNLETVNLGMRTSGLLVFGISPIQQVRSDGEAVRFYQGLLNRLRGLPGVESATLMQNRLGSGWSNNTGATIDGANPLGQGFAPMRWNAVGPDYFHTLGTPVLIGRDFTEADDLNTPKVVVVNQTFANRYLAGRPPLGHQVSRSSKADAPQYTIVGVVPDSKYTEVREAARPMAYFPYTQIPSIGAMHLELRTAGDPASWLPAVRRAVGEYAPGTPLLRPMTQRAQFESTYTDERLFFRLSLFFGLLAALLVATGLYGTLAYTVSRRTAEVGVRMALGAQRRDVLWMVLRGSLGVTLAGIAAGLPLAVASTRLLRSVLFGVRPGDPLVYAAAIAGIVVVSLAASLLPALRAASVDPMRALRDE
jgi:predicted permease